MYDQIHVTLISNICVITKIIIVFPNHVFLKTMFETDTWYGLEILQQCGKGVKSKSQKVFSNVSRDCRGKTG